MPLLSGIVESKEVHPISSTSFTPKKTKGSPTLSFLKTLACSIDFKIWIFCMKFLGWTLIILIYVEDLVSYHSNKHCNSYKTTKNYILKKDY